MKTGNKAETQEEKENIKNTRNVLKTLQKAASDKENLIGRIHADKDKSAGASIKRKAEVLDKGVQTGEGTITEEDLISNEPSAEYWKKLAKKREELLNESYEDIERLKETIEALEEENKICKDMLDESRHLVEVLQEIVAESGETELAEEATEDH